ncbi:NB-ARC domain-containing protein [Acaryochloris marina NIES-2412]|uniref:NB-ARC domain-containing protein n=1 Tax=Acaryochloris marina TaxID=155978 RepID=UPI004059B556
MNLLVSFAQVVNVVDSISIHVRDKGVNDAETVALRAAWEKIHYSQAIFESGVSYNEIYVRSEAGRNLWRMLSDHFETKITKSNFREYFEGHPALLATKIVPTDILGGNPPSAKEFIGRIDEIRQLKQLSKTNQCICISGISGIGKSSLAAKVISQLAKKSPLFDYFVWLPVHYQPVLRNLLKKLLLYLDKGESASTLSSQDLSDLLLQFLQQNRCLIVLDEVDSILGLQSPPDIREEYQVFFRRMVEEQHQSCFWLTAKNFVEELSMYQQMRLPIKIMQLGSLSQKDAQQFIESQGIVFDADWGQMIHSCMGNPLLMQAVIKKVIKAQDGKASLVSEKTSLALDEFEYVLKRLFDNATDVKNFEILVLFKTAILQEGYESVPLQALTHEILKIKPDLANIDVINCLERLQKHNLIDLTTNNEGAAIVMGNTIKKYILRKYANNLEKELDNFL